MDSLKEIYGETYSGWWFFAIPLKNMSSSVGMMTFPIYGKNKNHVPNHQPVSCSPNVKLSFRCCLRPMEGWGEMAIWHEINYVKHLPATHKIASIKNRHQVWWLCGAKWTCHHQYNTIPMMECIEIVPFGFPNVRGIFLVTLVGLDHSCDILGLYPSSLQAFF